MRRGRSRPWPGRGDRLEEHPRPVRHLGAGRADADPHLGAAARGAARRRTRPPVAGVGPCGACCHACRALLTCQSGSGSPVRPDRLGARRARVSASGTPRCGGTSRPAGRSRGRAHRRHRARPRRQLFRAPGAGRRRGAQRRRRVHRLPVDAGVGARRDAGLPHLDDAGRPGATTRPASCSSSEDPAIGVEDVVIPLVAECDDSLPVRRPADAGRRSDDVREALAAARRLGRASACPPDEGAVGAGTGMSCLGWKGGIGTASRVAAVRPHRRRRWC